MTAPMTTPTITLMTTRERSMNRRCMTGAMVRAVLLLAVATGAAQSQNYRAAVGVRGFDGPVALDTIALEYTVAAPPGAVYHALDDAFKGFGIPVTTRDSAGGVMGNAAYRRSRTLANAPASKYLNCGAGMTGLNADEMRLTIAIIAIVDPDKAGGTRLRIGMVATAEDVIGQSRPAIGCGSTGRLEGAIADVVKKKLNG